MKGSFVCFLTGEISWPIAFVLAALAAIAVVVIVEVRKTPKQEAAMISREDGAISQGPEDPVKWRDGFPETRSSAVQLS